MLTIRREQMEAFSKAMRRRFEDRLVVHLRRKFLDDYKKLGEQGVRARAQAGIERAAGYGVTIECDVARFVELMFRLTESFDTDPQYPWAAEVLGDADMGSHPKMDLVCERAELEIARGRDLGWETGHGETWI